MQASAASRLKGILQLLLSSLERVGQREGVTQTLWRRHRPGPRVEELGSLDAGLADNHAGPCPAPAAAPGPPGMLAWQLETGCGVRAGGGRGWHPADDLQEAQEALDEACGADML